ncbi:MAG: glycosyltransferase family 2 protein [Microbacteriaceae bacterium]
MTQLPVALPTVSIIIPAYNEEQRIRQCLMAAIYQSVPAEEILVVDNLSTDSTASIVQQLIEEFPEANIRYLQQSEVQGLIPTRNLGFNRAIGDVFGRIDADSVLEPGWVAEVKRIFADKHVFGATGPVLYYDMPLRRFGLHADNALRKTLSKLNRKYQLLFGSNMAISRAAWQQIAAEVCLDEDDLLHEDIDLSVHLTDHHLKVQYSSKMVSGMSARRLEDSPKDYRFYVMRFERTYKSHGITSKRLRLPIVIFMSIYFPLHFLRKFVHRPKKRLSGEAEQLLTQSHSNGAKPSP